MSERRARIEEALHECAGMGVPDSVDLWPEIREHAVDKPRRVRRFRFVPRTRAGWVFAVLVALLIVSTGVYATGGIMDVLDFISGQTVPYIQKHELGAPVNEEQSRDGVTVTIDRVYADSAYVVVGFHVDGLDKLADEPSNPRNDLFANVRLSDPTAKSSSKAFTRLTGHWSNWIHPDDAAPGVPIPPRGSQVGVVVFESTTQLKSEEKHRFRVRVDITHGASREPIMPPFFFDLEVPVREAPVIEVNRTVEANGIPITLTRVVNSPVQTDAYLCFDPPEGRYDLPMVKTHPFGRPFQARVSVNYSRQEYAPGAVQKGCATYSYRETLYDKPGTHRLIVTELTPSDPYTSGIKGPWRFSFTVPER